ncbi:hypothetical protein ACFYZJ_03215 [Streptomyces sp. NPDC001848]|uniref:hypothetical protein n=1 Tax=Streptomyces sp. NPDC001848 TaxID=3364618 RepID=UPI00369543B8
MDTLIGEIARRTPQRFVDRILLPGLLFVVLALAGRELGQTHWADVHRLYRPLTHALTDARGDRTARLAALAVLIVPLAAASGFAVQAVTRITEVVWSGHWPRPAAPLARALIAVRARRWRRARTRYEEAAREALARRTPAAAALAALRLAQQFSIARYEPQSATWTGDRMHATQLRVRETYGLDLGIVWSRLWLVLPETARQEVALARERSAAPAWSATWAVCYLFLGIWWWPAVVVAVLLGAYAWHANRTAVDAFADVVEATVDLYGRQLADELGVPTSGPRLTKSDGSQANRIVRKGP